VGDESVVHEGSETVRSPCPKRGPGVHHPETEKSPIRRVNRAISPPSTPWWWRWN